MQLITLCNQYPFWKKIKLMGAISGVHEIFCQGRVWVKAIVTAAFFLPVTPWEKGFPFMHLSHAENTVLVMNTKWYTLASQTVTL